MANEYRMTGIVFTRKSSRINLENFVGDLVCNGWEGPVPVSHPALDPEDLTSHVKTWGGYLYPDMRLMLRSANGVTRTFRTEEVLMGDFAESDCLKQSEVIIGRESYPGFRKPQSDDAVAIFMTDSRFAPPYRWIQTVVDKYYDAGLRFFFISYDLGDASYGSAHLTVFYSAEATNPAEAQPFLMDGSRHCITMNTEIDVGWNGQE